MPFVFYFSIGDFYFVKTEALLVFTGFPKLHHILKPNDSPISLDPYHLGAPSEYNSEFENLNFNLIRYGELQMC